jgi:glycosyltransferase involved in cell wall biosynthesis
VPSVSVVVSTFNRKRLLLQTLRSVLQSSLPDLEVIVVDNGSSDGTSELLSRLRDPRLRVLRNDTSRGPTGGRNTGLAAARGTWVGIVDDDDLWSPDKLLDQVLALEASGRSWSYVGCVYVDAESRLVGGRPPPLPDEAMATLPVRYVIPGGLSGMVWRREALDLFGCLDEELVYATDWDLSLRLARLGPPAVVARPHVAWRLHGAQVSQHVDRFEHEFDVIAEKHADLRAGRPVIRWAHHRFAGQMNLLAGHRRAAIASYLRAVRHGDLSSLGRLALVAMPSRGRRAIVRRVRGDRSYLAEAEGWLAPLRDDVASAAEIRTAPSPSSPP